MTEVLVGAAVSALAFGVLVLFVWRDLAPAAGLHGGGRWFLVAALGTEQLDQMFEAIGELEAACARHAALRMTPPDRDQLMELHREGRAAMQASDFERYDAANLALHTAIIRGSYNPVLIDMATSLRHRVAPFRRTQFRNMERMGESFEEHAVIVEAILAHDAVTTYRQMRTHLQSARTATSRVAPAWASAQPLTK